MILLTRMGTARHPDTGELVQDNDTIHVLGTASQIEAFDRALSATERQP